MVELRKGNLIFSIGGNRLNTFRLSTFFGQYLLLQITFNDTFTELQFQNNFSTNDSRFSELVKFVNQAVLANRPSATVV